MIKTPQFWRRKLSLISILLLPVAFVYWLITRCRIDCTKPYKASVPVICIGNLTVGGSGKTPLCLYLADLLKVKRKRIFFLTRGYKAKGNNIFVRAYSHTATEVGDEPLLLAQKAGTIISSDRVKGAKLAIEKEAEAIIMDDGYQNPKLAKDAGIIVIDGPAGLGNKRIFPAGPLRETLAAGLKRASAVVIIGEDKYNLTTDILKRYPNLPVLHGQTIPNREKVETLKKLSVLAFAGIARPSKFYETLRQNGINILKAIDFPDHHMYREKDLLRLEREATTLGALMLTTEKDFMRIGKEWHQKIHYLDIELKIEQEHKLLKILDGVV